MCCAVFMHCPFGCDSHEHMKAFFARKRCAVPFIQFVSRSARRPLVTDNLDCLIVGWLVGVCERLSDCAVLCISVFFMGVYVGLFPIGSSCLVSLLNCVSFC